MHCQCVRSSVPRAQGPPDSAGEADAFALKQLDGPRVGVLGVSTNSWRRDIAVSGGGLPLRGFGEESQVEAERFGGADRQRRDVWMPRVDQEVGFLGDDGAGDLEDERGLIRDPGIPEHLQGSGARIRAPVGGKPLRGEPGDRMVRKSGRDQYGKGYRTPFWP